MQQYSLKYIKLFLLPIVVFNSFDLNWFKKNNLISKFYLITFALLLLLLYMYKYLYSNILKISLIIVSCFAIFTFTIIESYGQKKPILQKSGQSAQMDSQTPFNFLIGTWASYNRESTFAAYCHIKPISSGNAIEIKMEHPDGTLSVGLIYTDAMDSRWKLVWVGADGSDLTGNGIRYYEPGLNPDRYVFKGNTNVKGQPAIDRYVFENVNKDTVIKSYEISLDGGKSWEVEYIFTFKRNNK